jgi:hypothetical protein
MVYTEILPKTAQQNIGRYDSKEARKRMAKKTSYISQIILDAKIEFYKHLNDLAQEKTA